MRIRVLGTWKLKSACCIGSAHWGTQGHVPLWILRTRNLKKDAVNCLLIDYFCVRYYSRICGLLLWSIVITINDVLTCGFYNNYIS